MTGAAPRQELALSLEPIQLRRQYAELLHKQVVVSLSAHIIVELEVHEYANQQTIISCSSIELCCFLLPSWNQSVNTLTDILLNRSGCLLRRREFFVFQVIDNVVRTHFIRQDDTNERFCNVTAKAVDVLNAPDSPANFAQPVEI